MSGATGPIREARAMIAAMTPVLEPSEFGFCAASDAETIARAQTLALGWFREREGVSLILERGAAQVLGFDVGLPMSRPPGRPATTSWQAK